MFPDQNMSREYLIIKIYSCKTHIYLFSKLVADNSDISRGIFVVSKMPDAVLFFCMIFFIGTITAQSYNYEQTQYPLKVQSN